MSDTYKSAWDKIIVPPETIEKTALKLRQAGRDTDREEEYSRYMRYRKLAGVCVAVLIMLPVLIIAFLSDQGPIITQLEAGRHVEQVELKDGYLSFVQDYDSSVVLPPPLFSSPGIRKEEWEPERYREYAGADLTIGYLPLGMVLTEESVAVYVSADGNILGDCYTRDFASDSGSLEISVSKGKLPPQSNPGLDENSLINDNPLVVGISQDAETYWAQCLIGGVGYHVGANGLSQKEFIKILHSIFG
ncbi:MAG: hypothetical protein LBH28_07395 [Oscillospiraceae bacterium]|jgi:hypothetical protein|nr:hypothetical protein [Oscillospiraceae bacterium]